MAKETTLTKRQQLIAHWNTKAIEMLEGRTIEKAFFMSEDESQRDWEWHGNRGLVLVLDDGTRCTVCADPEKNGPGSLHVYSPKLGAESLGPL